MPFRGPDSPIWGEFSSLSAGSDLTAISAIGPSAVQATMAPSGEILCLLPGSLSQAGTKSAFLAARVSESYSLSKRLETPQDASKTRTSRATSTAQAPTTATLDGMRTRPKRRLVTGRWWISTAALSTGSITNSSHGASTGSSSQRSPGSSALFGLSLRRHSIEP